MVSCCQHGSVLKCVFARTTAYTTILNIILCSHMLPGVIGVDTATVAPRAPVLATPVLMAQSNANPAGLPQAQAYPIPVRANCYIL